MYDRGVGSTIVLRNRLLLVRFLVLEYHSRYPYVIFARLCALSSANEIVCNVEKATGAHFQEL